MAAVKFRNSFQQNLSDESCKNKGKISPVWISYRKLLILIVTVTYGDESPNKF
jgi:hypothetical protein